MTDQLESDLRHALHARAGEVPATSLTRLTGVDYRPRTRGLRSPVAIGALAGGAGAAGAAVALVSLTAGASSAFAGWTSTPTPPSPTQLQAAAADCKARSPIDGLPLVLADTRGPFTFEIYADSQQTAECISGPSFTSVSGSFSSAPVTVPAGKVLLTSAHETARDGQAYSFADGHTGSGVTGVTLVLDNGATVQATVDNGWFVAWWPGAHEVKAADVTTPAGTTRQSFDVQRPGACGAMACAGSGVVRGSSVTATGSAGGGGTATVSEGFSISR
jgi:hypothetical protein